MNGSESPSITQLLQRLGDGDREVGNAVIGELYADLRARAARFVNRRSAGMTLQPTALVHEAYMKLMESPERTWADRQQFLSVASLAMRQICVDHFRAKNSLKRGAAGRQVTLQGLVDDAQTRIVDLLDLDEVLTRLAKFDAEMARAVELKFFAGATMEEASSILGLTKRTVERRWSAARAWLSKELEEPGGNGSR